MKLISDFTILFVDDDPEVLNSLRRFLRREPYRLLFADGGHSALQILESQPVDIIISDLRMPEMDGVSLLHQVETEFPEVIRLILSADLEQSEKAANRAKVFRFIPKPLDTQTFKKIITDAIDYCRLKMEHQELPSVLSHSSGG